MKAWLLDTKSCPNFGGRSPKREWLRSSPAHALDLLYVSTVSLAEIRLGIETVTDAARRRDLVDWLPHTVRPRFEQRVLAISEDIMLKWRLLVEDGRRAGHTYSQPDLIIAETAIHHGLTVVSRDVSQFE